MTTETILDKAKAAADEYAREIGGAWVVLGNPAHVARFTKMRDVSITEEFNAPAMMIDGDKILYRAEAV